MKHCCRTFLALCLSAAVLTACGGTSSDTSASAPAAPSSGLVATGSVTTPSTSTDSTTATTLPPGPPIGQFVQPKDVIVTAERDATTPSSNTKSIDSTSLGRALDIGKASDIIATTDSSWFTRYGTTSLWHQAYIGYSGHIWWTRNNTYTEDDYAVWTPYLQCAGNYQVSAYIPNNYASTTQARYKVNHVYGTTQQNIVQNNYYNQWVLLGGASYTFNQGSGGSVKLADATGESTGSHMIGFDAMMWHYVSPSSNMYLTVNSPNGGETWYKGSANGSCVPVTWSTGGLSDNVRIHLYRYGSISKGLITSTSNNGYYCIPTSYFSDQANGGGYTIAMSNVNSYCDGVVYDSSNSSFTIANSTISVSNPSSGTYTSGNSISTNWSTVGVSGNVKIDLYQNGSFYTTITSSTSNSGSYTWYTPSSYNASGFSIRVSSTNDSSVYGTSGTFTLAKSNSAPVTTITTNGGSSFITTQSTVTLSGSCTDVDGNLNQADFYDNIWENTPNISGGSWSFNQSVPLQNGGNIVYATCYDTNGLSSTKTISITSTQTGTISGTVTASTGGTLPGATVKVIGPTTKSTTTNGNGQYTLSLLTPGSYSVQSTMSGYLDSSVQNISVGAGSTYTSNFTLTKVPAPSLYFSPTNISTTMNSGSINSTQSFVIKNNGDATLTYTLSPNVAWASIQRNGATVSGVSQSLAPGIQAAYTVVFNSNGITSSKSGAISISSNDSSQSGSSISLSMGINAPPPPPPPPANQPAPTTPTFQPAIYGQCMATQNRCYADPVNTAIGNYTYQHTDMAISARGPDLVFARHYNSLDTTIGSLGMGWTHSLNIYLMVAGNGDAYVRWGNGRTDAYTYNSGDGSFTPPAGVFNSLTKGSQYILTDKDQNVWVFSLAGQLQSITDRLNNKLTLAYDSQGRLTTATNSIGDTFTYAYVSSTSSLLASVTDSTGRVVQFAYNGNLLTQVTDAKGKSFTFGYDSGNRLNQVSERDGKTLVTNTYDSNGRVTDQYDALNDHTQFAYDTPSAGQTTITDPTGKTHVYSYDSLYRLTSQKGPTGDQVTFLYNTANLPTQITDANAKVTTSAYDSRGNVTSVTDAAGAISSWAYDTLDRVTSSTNLLGQVTTYSYDTNGNLSQISSTLNGVAHTTTLTYLSTGELASATDPMGGVTTYTYNNKGELTAVKNPNNETVQFGYDVLHRTTSVTDPLSHSTTIAYDANDNATSETNALNQTTTITYDARDQSSSVAAPAGTTNFTYDAAGHLTQVAAPAGTTTYTYNTINQRTAITDPAGHQTSFAYNSLGYLTGVTDATGKSVSYSYDPMGRLLSATNSAGQTTSFTRDAIGRPTKVTDPLGNAITTAYNSASLPTQATDPASNVFKTTYDNFGRPTQSTNALQGVTSQTYDKNSRLTQLTTPANTTYNWTYDNVGRITSLTSPSGKKKSFAYDAAGRLTSITDASNQTTSLTYDAGNHLTQTTFADSVTRAITYDSANRPTQIAQGGKARTYSYDSANRIASSVDVWGKTISYAYDTAGHLSTLTYPGNKSVAYGYDAAGRLTSVTDWNNGVTSYSYDSAGRLSQISYPNGVKTVRGYDNDSHVTSIQHKLSNGTAFYSQTIAYDSRGNITSTDVSPEPTGWIKVDSANYSSNAEDQYTGVGSDTLGYDPVGQMLSHSSGTSYAFDARERLVTAVTPTVTASYSYGPNGERIQKVVGTTTTRYVVDTNSPLPRVLAELDASNLPTTYYIYGIGLLAQAPATGSAIHYYHSDIQHNIVALTDSTGAVTDTYFYHPFGKVLAKTGTTVNPYQFSGALGVAQDETGLLYMRARYYDPLLGRFVSKDPLGLAAGINPYAYVINNPMRFTDSSGECLEDLCIGESIFATTLIVEYGPSLLEWGANLINYTPQLDVTADSIGQAYQDPSPINVLNAGMNSAMFLPIGEMSSALGKGASTAAEDLNAYEKGVAGEKAIEDATGVSRNVGAGRETVPGTGRGGYRVPDFNTQESMAIRNTIMESKNVAQLPHMTPQLNDLLKFAESKGVPLEIFTRSDTVIGDDIQALANSGKIRLSTIPSAADPNMFVGLSNFAGGYVTGEYAAKATSYFANGDNNASGK